MRAPHSSSVSSICNFEPLILVPFEEEWLIITGSLASARMRIRTLQAALKRGPVIVSARGQQGNSKEIQNGPYSFRSRRAAPGALAESNFDGIFDFIDFIDTISEPFIHADVKRGVRCCEKCEALSHFCSTN